jgi:hypothetical protein
MGILDKFIGPPSRDKFAQLVIRSILRAGEKRRVAYDRDDFRIHPQDDLKTYIELEDLFDSYVAADAAARSDVMRIAVRNWFIELNEIPSNFDDARHDLLPAIHPRWHFEQSLLQLRLGGSSPPDWPYDLLGEHFSVSLVYDLPDAVQILPEVQLEEWGVTYFDALQTACLNLAEHGEAVFGKVGDSQVYLSTTRDKYDAARLVLPDLIHEFQLNGDPVAMIPNRDQLILTGADDAEGLMLMAALAEEALKQPEPMLAIPLRLVNNEWVDWLPPYGHPAHLPMKVLQMQSLGECCNNQKELLEKLHKQTGDKVFVASYSGMQSQETGKAFSYCVWTKGVPSLLPRTDKILFVSRPEAEDVVADWDTVESVVGNLLTPIDIYPARFRVSDFPTRDQLAKLARP